MCLFCTQGQKFRGMRLKVHLVSCLTDDDWSTLVRKVRARISFLALYSMETYTQKILRLLEEAKIKFEENSLFPKLYTQVLYLVQRWVNGLLQLEKNISILNYWLWIQNVNLHLSLCLCLEKPFKFKTKIWLIFPNFCSLYSQGLYQFSFSFFLKLSINFEYFNKILIAAFTALI